MYGYCQAESQLFSFVLNILFFFDHFTFYSSILCVFSKIAKRWYLVDILDNNIHLEFVHCTTLICCLPCLLFSLLLFLMSLYREVECYDTVEGAQCGPCPTGYSGNGRSCTLLNACQSNPCPSGKKCWKYYKQCSLLYVLKLN